MRTEDVGAPNAPGSESTASSPSPFGAQGVELDESPTLAKLATALAKAQGAITLAAEAAKNPHLGSRYADLGSIWEACRRPLAENGLAVLQPVTTTSQGVVVETLLIHESGEFIRRRLAVPVEVRLSKEGKSQPWMWSFGAAVTYARRFGLAAMVGVATRGDEEGAGSAGQPDTSRARPPRESKPPESRPPPERQTAAEPKSEPPTPWQNILTICAKHGKSKEQAASITKGATGKSLPRELTEADVARVQASLDALAPPEAA